MKFYSTKKNILIASLVLFFVFLSTFIWLINAKPVLIEWYYGINFGSICDPPFVVLNPLRNREAEKVTDEFLEKIKGGNLEVLDNIVSDAERLEHIKSRESSSTIKTWFAADRTEDENKISFIYWIEREYEGGCQHMPTGIELERYDNTWKVISFNPSY